MGFVVARIDIPQGTEIKRDAVGLHNGPLFDPPPNAYIDTAVVIGIITRIDIAAGQLILPGMLDMLKAD